MQTFLAGLIASALGLEQLKQSGAVYANAAH